MERKVCEAGDQMRHGDVRQRSGGSHGVRGSGPAKPVPPSKTEDRRNFGR